MSEFAVLLAVAVVAIAVVVWLVVERVQAAKLAVRRQVVVNVRGGRAFRGALWVRRGRVIVLRGTQMLDPGRAPVPVDGDVIIDRDEIEFIQVTGG